MTNIKEIVSGNRAKLEAAGLLKPATANPVSAEIKAHRPSLHKVMTALIKNPDRFAIVQRSPFSTLFDVVLPRLEPQLIEFGEEHSVNDLINYFCSFGQSIINKHGLDRSRQFLEGIFGVLPDFFDRPLGLTTIKLIFDNIYLLCFDNTNNAAAKIIILGRLDVNVKVEPDYGLTIETVPGYMINLSYLKWIKQLKGLRLDQCRLHDNDLARLSALTNLEKLNLMQNHSISNAGLAHLAGLTRLKELVLFRTGINNGCLVHLSKLANLEDLNLSQTGVTDDALPFLAQMPQLKRVTLRSCSATETGLNKLRTRRPDLDISV